MDEDFELASSRAMGDSAGKDRAAAHVPTWPEFLRGCLRYRESLDRKLPNGPRDLMHRIGSDAMASVERLAFVLIATWASACGSDAPAAPSSRAVVTFAVGTELFRVALTGSDQVAAALAAQSGGRASIPNGRIVPGTQINTGWNWHLEDVAFAEAAIELCDGRPSDVERQGTGFDGGHFCPWGATIVRIEEM
jgi:hypothetical protein